MNSETYNPTGEFITNLAGLGSGDLSVLRSLKGQPLDETVAGFDLFAGLWWPLREKSQKAPRREIAWLVAKLFANRRLEHQPNVPLAVQLSRCRSNKDPTSVGRIDQRFDELLAVSVTRIESHLCWALGEIQRWGRARGITSGIDWMQLTDDLSGWHRDYIRQRWVDDYLNLNEEQSNAD